MREAPGLENMLPPATLRKEGRSPAKPVLPRDRYAGGVR